MTSEDMARPIGPGSHEPSPDGLGPSGFDPSRITELLQGINEKCLAPIIRKAADDFYERVLGEAQDYLADNLDYNLRAELAHLRAENQRMRTELYETRRMVGNCHDPHDETLQAIGNLDRKAVQYSELIYAVGRKYDGETRHETALRYIRQAEEGSRDRDGNPEGGDACGSVHDGPAIAQ